MDKIEKIICVDNSRSHRNGLLPFVYYNKDNEYIVDVTGDNINGNFGQYVCDFAIFNGDEEISRLKYLDVIQRYNFIQEQIRNGILVKKVPSVFRDLEKIGCNNENETIINSGETYVFITDFEELYTKRIYEFQPIDINLFYEENGVYKYINKSLDKDALNAIFKVDYYILLPNCDEVIKYNEMWDEWWIGNFDDSDCDGKSCGLAKSFGGNDPYIFKGYVAELGEINENFKFCYEVDKYLLGRIEVVNGKDETKCGDLTLTGSLVPKYVYKTELFDRIKWFEDNSGITMTAYSTAEKTDDYIIKKWKEKGGGEFYDFLVAQDSICSWQTKKEREYTNSKFNGSKGTFAYVPPKIEVDIILNNDIENERIYSPYEYSIINDRVENVVQPYNSEDTVDLCSKFIECFINIESELESLTHPTAIQITDNIFGIYETFENDCQMYKCTLMSGDTTDINGIVCNIEEIENESGDTIYQWWYCEEVTNDGFTCADGEGVKPNTEGKYRNITILSTLKNVADSCKYGEWYYFLVKYKNGTKYENGNIIEYYNVGIPYKKDEPLNISTYDDGTIIGDMVVNIQESNDKGYITIEYVKGATFTTNDSGLTYICTSETGVYYRDKIKYEPNKKEIILLDGIDECEIFYNKLLLKESKKEIDSDDFNQKRYVLMSVIYKMEVGNVWTNENAITTPLITRDGIDVLYEEPKYDINITIDRGNASAWEKHFKLSECNTMEDLVNYGNNFFNL